MDEHARFYRRNGFLIKPWAKTPSLQRLNSLCLDLFQGRIKDGYQSVLHHHGMATDVALDQKYDPLLIDVLFENGLPELLRDIVGPNATLFYINAITSLPPGYMSNWHCDGFRRHVHKLLFYPSFDGKSEPCLEVVPEPVKPWWITYRRFNRVNKIMQVRTALRTKQAIGSSDDQFVLLHTETPHRAAPVANQNGIFRLIYNFMDWFKDDEERQRLSAFPIVGSKTDAYSRINDDLVTYYQRRLVEHSLVTAGPSR